MLMKQLLSQAGVEHILVPNTKIGQPNDFRLNGIVKAGMRERLLEWCAYRRAAAERGEVVPRLTKELIMGKHLVCLLTPHSTLPHHCHTTHDTHYYNQQFLAEVWYIVLRSETIFKVYRKIGVNLSLDGHDKHWFGPSVPEKMEPPLPDEKTLLSFLTPQQAPQAFAPDSFVGPGQARKTDRKAIQEGTTTLKAVAPKRARYVNGRQVRPRTKEPQAETRIQTRAFQVTSSTRASMPNLPSRITESHEEGFPPDYADGRYFVAVQEVPGSGVCEVVNQLGRTWNLGKIVDHKLEKSEGIIHRKVQLIMYGTYDQNLIHGEYFPARYDTKGRPGWLYSNRNRNPQKNWYDWDSEVFVTDCKLENNVLPEEDQEVLLQACEEKGFPVETPCLD